MLSFVGNLDTTSGLYESRHGEKEREEGGGEGGKFMIIHEEKWTRKIIPNKN